MNCPRCHRPTYSAKWKQCTACQYEDDVTNKANIVTPAELIVTRKRGRLKQYANSTERVRAWRARQKAKA